MWCCTRFLITRNQWNQSLYMFRCHNRRESSHKTYLKLIKGDTERIFRFGGKWNSQDVSSEQFNRNFFRLSLVFIPRGRRKVDLFYFAWNWWTVFKRRISTLTDKHFSSLIWGQLVKKLNGNRLLEISFLLNRFISSVDSNISTFEKKSLHSWYPKT